MTDDIRYWHSFKLIDGVGPKAMRRLLNFFPTAEAAWQASISELTQGGIGPKLAQKIIEQRSAIHPDEEWERLEAFGIEAIPVTSPEYPSLLKEIHHPPFVIYKRGSFDWNSRPLVTIVGSRRCTAYGEQVAHTLARELSQAGITVVSGLAFGIDALAHQGALEGGGTTVAVLGNSLDNDSIAPRTNFPLAQKILKQGALLSEYPPVTPASNVTFPARNRLMAGMSLGTIVVEAAEQSGSLITARMALDSNREVFAVPGSIFSLSSGGCHQLIRKGAKIVTGLNDILEELSLTRSSVSENIQDLSDLSPTEATVMKHLSNEPLHIDKLVKAITLDTFAVNSTLVLLEIKGRVKNVGGMHYIRNY